MNARHIIERESQVVVPGSGGRHRRWREPSLPRLVLRRLLAGARGASR